MAGDSLGVTGPIHMRNPGLLLDVRLAPGATFRQPVPADWSGFAYVYAGEHRPTLIPSLDMHIAVRPFCACWAS